LSQKHQTKDDEVTPKNRRIAYLTGLFSLAAVIGMLYYASLFLADYRQYNKLTMGKSADYISVNETKNYPDAAIFHFNDGFPLNHFVGQASYSIFGEGFFDSGTDYIYVVPIVSEDWQAGDPVPLWGGCQSASYLSLPEPDELCQKSWAEPYRAGQIVSYNLSYYRQAVRDAEKQYGLKSDPQAPIIHWTEVSEKTVEAALSTSGWFLLKWGCIASIFALLAVTFGVFAFKGISPLPASRSR
jgi:hypothetical protein